MSDHGNEITHLFPSTVTVTAQLVRDGHVWREELCEERTGHLVDLVFRFDGRILKDHNGKPRYCNHKRFRAALVRLANGHSFLAPLRAETIQTRKLGRPRKDRVPNEQRSLFS